MGPRSGGELRYSGVPLRGGDIKQEEDDKIEILKFLRKIGRRPKEICGGGSDWDMGIRSPEWTWSEWTAREAGVNTCGGGRGLGPN
ncbi:hypothetical protein NDU88_003644 [Pleurodeles waltl]|uniref:Uncharacterized protein n=1 Tax=Pleurodeles waltl TaxID=8319 RepID=A0AAV7QCP4_PLEWA|nr:hypothetical protein NDU88_003644 [Pleurodeles waltl]